MVGAKEDPHNFLIMHAMAPNVAGVVGSAVAAGMAGMFGLGAGWANVPVLNLLMGAPLKISVATSKFLLSITDTSAAWVYLNQGCVIPLMVVPSLVGIMLGYVFAFMRKEKRLLDIIDRRMNG